ncbi:MAG: helix-turn-helix domain-containing protein [Pseudomonadota bacterium]
MSSSTDTASLKGFDAYEVKLGDELRGERATKGKSLLDVQRELRIRASYIAAIEDCDLEVFPNPGFVAGYVRSYARYLGIDEDHVFGRFCDETGFGGVNAGLHTRKAPASGRIVASGPVRVAAGDPLLKPVYRPSADLTPGVFERLSLSAIGSVLVLALLLVGVGYGGYRVLQSIQRVTIAPVDQRPDTVSTMAGLRPPGLGVVEVTLNQTEPQDAGTADADLARLYQPRELEIPVVEARDGPIVDIDPRRAGLFADLSPEQADVARAEADAIAEAIDSLEAEPQVREPVGAPNVNVVARQPAWVRVYLADGTVLFEKILETGELYTLPLDVEAPLLRAGNSGSVYLLVDDMPYGPLGNSASVVKDISLLPDDIVTVWPEVADPPEVIQATVSALQVPPPQQ